MILIIAVLIVFALVAFYGTRYRVKKKNKQMLLALAYEEMVFKNRLMIEHAEVLGNRVIALDRKQKKFLMIDGNGPKKEPICIPLWRVMQTEIVEEQNSEGNIQKVFLLLKCKTHDIRYKLCFYDEAHDDLTDLPCFSKKALHWKNRVDINRFPGVVDLEQEYRI